MGKRNQKQKQTGATISTEYGYKPEKETESWLMWKYVVEVMSS